MMFTLPFITAICSASLIFVTPSFFKLLLVLSSMVPSAPITSGITSPVEHSACANSLVISFSYFFCFSSNRCFTCCVDVSYGHVTHVTSIRMQWSFFTSVISGLQSSLPQCHALSIHILF